MTLEILTSDALEGTRHGFFTRRGGVSSGIYKGLNCGIGSGDERQAVDLNRERVANAMGVAPQALVTLHQVHSNRVEVIDTPPPTDAPRPRADAMVTRQPGIALAVLSADCQPVLFADAEAGVIGAAHAGWRGARDGVLDQTVQAMVDLGADRDRISAVIGPCISQIAYEVGPEFVEDFLTEDPDNARFFAGGTGDRAQFDLPGFGLHSLRAAGVGYAEWLRACTYSEPDRFFSYRRATHAGEPDYGRLIAAIAL